jgi:hypothetical protein
MMDIYVLLLEDFGIYISSTEIVIINKQIYQFCTVNFMKRGQETGAFNNKFTEAKFA